MPRPRYVWRGWDDGPAQISAGSARTINLGTAGNWPADITLGVIGEYTIRRIVGKIAGISSSVGGSDSINLLTWGVYIGEDDAVAGGVFPEPLQDPVDWFLYGSMMVSNSRFDTGGGMAMTSEVFDGRSMRKVNENHQTPIMRVENSSGSPDTVLVHTVGRTLYSIGRR